MVEKADSLKVVQHGGRHYKGMAIEPAEYCQRNNLKFCESNAIKYLSRHHLKGGLEDAKKALHYAQMVLEFEYGVIASVTYSDAQGTQNAEQVRKAAEIINEIQQEEQPQRPGHVARR